MGWQLARKEFSIIKSLRRIGGFRAIEAAEGTSTRRFTATLRYINDRLRKSLRISELRSF
jgi:hypothetical protein